jgi:hypothetical protein
MLVRGDHVESIDDNNIPCLHPDGKEKVMCNMNARNFGKKREGDRIRGALTWPWTAKTFEPPPIELTAEGMILAATKVLRDDIAD